jgi:DNA-binding transcriptional ArsR family regulator
MEAAVMAQHEPEQTTRDEEAVRAFVENFSTVFADVGMPRMAARVLIMEMVAEEDSLTAADLAERLGVSPAAISTALKYLLHIGLFARESVPNSRRDRYRATDPSWFSANLVKAGYIERLASAADEGIAPVGGPTTVAGARLSEMRDFYRFIMAAMPRLMQEWSSSRAARGDGGGDVTVS